MPFSTIPEAIDDIRAGRMVVVVRRRGPRERGRPHDRRREGDARRHQLHGPPRPRAHLPAHDRRAPGRAAHPAHGPGRGEQRALRHRVLRAHRGQAGHDHRHLRRRPRAHRARRDRPADASPRTSPAPATCSRCARMPGGVLERAGQTEAAVDLARLAGLYPAGVICEIMNEDGTMARVPEPRARSAATHGLRMITIKDLIQHRMRHERLVRKMAEASLPTSYGGLPHPRLREPHRRRAPRGPRAGRDRRPRTRSWCACTPSASPATSSPPPAATAASQLHKALEMISAGGQGRAALPAPGGARHRAHAQDHGLPAPGPGAGHRGGQRGPRLQGRPARLRHRRADPRRARGAEDPPPHEQPAEVRRPRGLRAQDRGAPARSRSPPPPRRAGAT